MKTTEICVTKLTEKIVSGLAERGIEIVGTSNIYLLQDRETAQLNSLAGERAPTWGLMVDGLWRDGGRKPRLIETGTYPTITVDGQTIEGCEIGSSHPATHIARTKPADWHLEWEGAQDLRVEAPTGPSSNLPPHGTTTTPSPTTGRGRI